MNVLKDLFDRLFVQWQSSAAGFAVAIATWLDTLGVTLSDANTEQLASFILKAGVAVFLLFKRDKPKTEGPPPLGQRI